MKSEVTGGRRLLRMFLFVIYLAVLVYLLFFSERYGRSESSTAYHYNLTLFKEIRRFYEHRETLGMQVVLVNLLGNVLAFVPFGFLLPELYPGIRSAIRIGFCTLGFSFLVECLQLLFRVGTFDVDDLLLNTIGGILGYGMLWAWLLLRGRT